MNRRDFLARVMAAPVAAALAAHLPVSAPVHRPIDIETPRKSGLLFHPDAFAFVAPPVSMRYVTHYNVQSGVPVHRLDILYGMGCIAPGTIVARVSS